VYNKVKKVKNIKKTRIDYFIMKVGDHMEIAKLSSKGQITIPIDVRKKLKLKSGDKVVIIEENGRFYMENSAMMAFSRATEDFAGVAEKAGFTNETEMQEYMKKIKKEVRGY